MKKFVVGNLKFTKPVVEKLIDIYTVNEENGKEVVKHEYFILTYEEIDNKEEEIINKALESNPKLLVIDETIYVNFGDEEIERHLDSKILYDEEWIETKSPDKENFEKWLISFVDELIYSAGDSCPT